jgi:acyl-CoA thioester hydrolase
MQTAEAGTSSRLIIGGMGSRLRGNYVVLARVTNRLKVLAIVTKLGPASGANVYYGRLPAPLAYVRYSTLTHKNAVKCFQYSLMPIEMSSVFTWTVRVYYEDTDAGGIVYYANYLKFFERARTEWLRALDIDQHALAGQQDAMFVVKSASVDYHAPAKLDDVITLTLGIEKLGRASIQFVQQASCGAALLASARVKVGCVDRAVRPRPLPDAVADKMRAA